MSGNDCSPIPDDKLMAYIYDDVDDSDIFGCEQLNNSFTENDAKDNENIKPADNKTIQILQEKLEKLQGEKELLELRISQMVKTARAELERKDRRLQELEQERNNVLFRRNNNARNKQRKQVSESEKELTNEEFQNFNTGYKIPKKILNESKEECQTIKRFGVLPDTTEEVPQYSRYEINQQDNRLAEENCKTPSKRGAFQNNRSRLRPRAPSGSPSMRESRSKSKENLKEFKPVVSRRKSVLVDDDREISKPVRRERSKTVTEESCNTPSSKFADRPRRRPRTPPGSLPRERSPEYCRSLSNEKGLKTESREKLPPRERRKSTCVEKSPEPARHTSSSKFADRPRRPPRTPPGSPLRERSPEYCRSVSNEKGLKTESREKVPPRERRKSTCVEKSPEGTLRLDNEDVKENKNEQKNLPSKSPTTDTLKKESRHKVTSKSRSTAYSRSNYNSDKEKNSRDRNRKEGDRRIKDTQSRDLRRPRSLSRERNCRGRDLRNRSRSSWRSYGSDNDRRDRKSSSSEHDRYNKHTIRPRYRDLQQRGRIYISRLRERVMRYSLERDPEALRHARKTCKDKKNDTDHSDLDDLRLHLSGASDEFSSVEGAKDAKDSDDEFELVKHLGTHVDDMSDEDLERLILAKKEEQKAMCSEPERSNFVLTQMEEGELTEDDDELFSCTSSFACNQTEKHLKFFSCSSSSFVSNQTEKHLQERDHKDYDKLKSKSPKEEFSSANIPNERKIIKKEGHSKSNKIVQSASIEQQIETKTEEVADKVPVKLSSSYDSIIEKIQKVKQEQLTFQLKHTEIPIKRPSSEAAKTLDVAMKAQATPCKDPRRDSSLKASFAEKKSPLEEKKPKKKIGLASYKQKQKVEPVVTQAEKTVDNTDGQPKEELPEYIETSKQADIENIHASDADGLTAVSNAEQEPSVSDVKISDDATNDVVIEKPKSDYFVSAKTLDVAMEAQATPCKDPRRDSSSKASFAEKKSPLKEKKPKKKIGLDSYKQRQKVEPVVTQAQKTVDNTDGQPKEEQPEDIETRKQTAVSNAEQEPSASNVKISDDAKENKPYDNVVIEKPKSDYFVFDDNKSDVSPQFCPGIADADEPMDRGTPCKDRNSFIHDFSMSEDEDRFPSDTPSIEGDSPESKPERKINILDVTILKPRDETPNKCSEEPQPQHQPQESSECIEQIQKAILTSSDAIIKSVCNSSNKNSSTLGELQKWLEDDLNDPKHELKKSSPRKPKKNVKKKKQETKNKSKKQQEKKAASNERMLSLFGSPASSSCGSPSPDLKQLKNAKKTLLKDQANKPKKKIARSKSLDVALLRTFSERNDEDLEETQNEKQSKSVNETQLINYPVFFNHPSYIPNPQINQVFDTASQYISRKKDEYKKNHDKAKITNKEIKAQEEKPKQKKGTKKIEKEHTDKKKSSFKIKFISASERAKKRKAMNDSIETATGKKKKLCNCSKDVIAEDCLECMTLDSKDSDFEEIIVHTAKIEEEELITCNEKINELVQKEINKITKPEQKRKPKRKTECTKKIENDPVETESPQRKGVRVRKQTSFYIEQITKKSPRRITPIKIGEVSTSKPCQSTQTTNDTCSEEKLGDFEGGYKTMQSPLPHMEEMLKKLEEKGSVDQPHENDSNPVIPEINLDTKDVENLGSFERDILENMSEYLGDKSLPSLHSEGKTNEPQKNVKDGENQLNFSDFLNKNTNTSTPIKKAEPSSESANTLTQSQASVPNVTSPNFIKSYFLAPLKRDRRRKVIVEWVDKT